MKQFYHLLPLKTHLVRTYQVKFRTAILIACLLFFLPESKAGQRDEKTLFIELSLTNETLLDGLKKIEEQTEYRFVINNSRLQVLNREVTMHFKDQNVKNILDKLLEGTDITYVIRKKQITLVPPSDKIEPVLKGKTESGSSSVKTGIGEMVASGLFSSSYDAIRISGKVTDDAGQPLPGVNIIEKGTTNGTVTGADGNYALIVSSEEAVLIFSFIGYITEEVPVNGRSEISFQMIQDIKTLSEILIVGYGSQERKDVTGAVSSVKGEDFQSLPIASPTQALQGRAAGVNVVRNGGAPGNAGSIRIRGIGTVNNADPLIIIDGVPAGNINDINPNDIESIEVLKDASSSAIYGTRAANGVVIVTTKRGKFDESIKFNVGGYYGVSNRIKTIDVLDAPTLALLKRERYLNDGEEVNSIWEDPAYQTQRTDWQKEVLGRGNVKNIDVSVSGGGSKSSFAMSGSLFDEQGMIKESFFKRYSFRLNSDHKLGERFKIGQNLQITNQKGNSPNTLSAQDGLLWSAIRFHPGLPVKNEDGTYSSSQISSEFGDINNPVFTIDNQDREFIRNRILGSITGEYEIVKGLKAKANLAIDAIFINNREFEIRIDNQTRQNSQNKLTEYNEKYYAFLQEYFLSYDKKIGSHNISFVGGATGQSFNGKWLRGIGEGFSNEDPDLRYFSMGAASTTIEGSRYYDALLSGFGRINYSFKDKYLLTATFRADGSSKFPEGSKWGNFPAFSLGWRVSDEAFFESFTKTVSTLKLTGGWGQLGNQEVGRLQYLARIKSDYHYAFGGGNVLGAAQSTIPNPGIGWETAEMTNFGLETGFLEDKLTAIFNYFIKDTKDMLLPPPALGSNGLARIPDQNVGELRNQGLEIELTYRKSTGDFTYSLGANAAFIKNEVTKLYDGSFLEGPAYGRTGQVISRTYEGNPIGTFYGWRTDGLYQNQGEIDSDPNISNDPRRADDLIQPGDVRFVDLNGDGLIDDQDREIIGNPQPKVTYGINGSLAYKNFDLNLFILGVGGVDIYNADRMQGIDPTYPFNMYAETVNRWNGEGTSNSIPRMSTKRDNLNYRTSDMFVESGDFLRLKNITLGYTLPQHIVESIKISEARIYVTGQNVFVITDYSGLDPELGIVDGNKFINVDYAQYPQARTWTIGASITF